MKKYFVLLLIWAMAPYPAYPADSTAEPSDKGEKASVGTSAQPSKGCGCPLEAPFQRLKESLKSPDSQARKSAAVALGNFPSSAPEIINILLEAITDDNREVRWAAITSLGKIGKQSPEAKDMLKLFVHDHDSTTAQKASLALANLGETDEEIITTIVRTLESASTEDSAIAVASIAKLLPSDEGKLLPVVLNGVKSKRDILVLNSLKVLKMAHTENDKAVSELVRIYSDVDRTARVLIIEALSVMDKMGSQIKPVLTKGFKDPDPKVRRAAIQVAGQSAGTPEVFKEQLLKALNDPDRENRLTALGITVAAGMLSKGHDKVILALRKDADPLIRARALFRLGVTGNHNPGSNNGPKVIPWRYERGGPHVSDSFIEKCRFAQARRCDPHSRRGLRLRKGS